MVHTATQALLLKRVDHANFWQSVTGALEWGELPRAAAQRELFEETGLADVELRDTGICRNYQILPQWRERYPPKVERNREHLFYCSLKTVPPIIINPSEHSEYRWRAIDSAQRELFSWSNRLAFTNLLAETNTQLDPTCVGWRVRRV